MTFIQKSEFIWYSIGIIIRIFSTLVYPQQGYIHPDEFFQGPEIVFDDIFQTNLTRTHEFHPSAPLRSVAILYLLYGLPISILSYISSLFQWSSISFNLKLIFPRMIILILSLCTDIIFYRLMKYFYPNLNSKQYGIIMNYYGISHVTIIFFTRTLSNSFEAFLFLTLIYLVNINSSSIILNQKKFFITRHLIFTSLLIGFICTLGIFNRPTFPAFACIPIIYWCIKVLSINNHHHSFHYQLFLSRIISFIISSFLITSSLVILFDSYYYNNGFSFIINLKNRLIICPLNFILYNIDSTNLDKHGLHPFWLHSTVNATILYGPLHLIAIIWSLTKIFMRMFSRNSNDNESFFSMSFYLYFIPFIPLSTFPHQEPRFLLPLIYPLILFLVPHLIKQNFHKKIFYLWLIFNISMTIIYGHMHQAGLLPALRYIHNIDMNKKILVTYHTYMPPGYLVTSMTKSDIEEKLQTIIIDLKGAKREEFDLTIENIFNEYSMNNIQVFVILPNTCRTDLIYLKEQKYSFNLLKQFQFHLGLDHNCEDPCHIKYIGTNYQSICTFWDRFKLDLYQVTRS